MCAWVCRWHAKAALRSEKEGRALEWTVNQKCWETGMDWLWGFVAICVWSWSNPIKFYARQVGVTPDRSLSTHMDINQNQSRPTGKPSHFTLSFFRKIIFTVGLSLPYLYSSNVYTEKFRGGNLQYSHLDIIFWGHFHLGFPYLCANAASDHVCFLLDYPQVNAAHIICSGVSVTLNKDW